MVSTRWKFAEKETNEDRLEELESKVLKISSDTLSDSQNSVDNVEVTSAFSDFKKKEYGSNRIRFNFYKIRYRKTSKLDSTSTEDDLWIILYELNSNFYLIINKNSGALTLLRKIFEYSGKSEITKVSHGINSQTIIWLISRIYNGEDNYGELNIDGIRGFKGDTEDSLNKISADGSGIMNILSTLSFLLESSYLKQIKLDLSYREHKNIELKIDVNGTIDVNKDKYRGELLSEDNNGLIYDQYLIVYNEVIPLIREWFNNSKDDNKETSDDQWWKKFYKAFLLQVSDDLKRQIDEKQKDLQ